MEKPSFKSPRENQPVFIITAVLLCLFGWAFVAFANPISGFHNQFQMVLIGIGLQIFVVLALSLDRNHQNVSRIFLVALLAAAIAFGSLGWNAPVMLALLIFPVGLAALLISIQFSFITVCLLTGMLLLGGAKSAWQIPFVTFPLVSIWGELLMLWVTLKPTFDFTTWVSDYYEQAQAVIAKSREQKLEHEQTLADLVHANEQLTRLNTLAQGLRQMAEDARTAKEQFVANVSHELRTPLNMILGFSENILQAPQSYGGSIPGALLADLTVIQRNAQHLSHLIDDVLDLSQIDTDQMALSREWVNVVEVVQDAVIAVQPLYQSKGLYLTADVQPGIPSLFCDRTRVREVLLNLLSNAGRFTEKGGVRVQVREEPNLGLLFSVSDTGPGISEENLQKIFQPFQQLDSSIRRRFGGSGLGLTISKRFVELHNGKIWIESKLGQGSTFFFHIPFQVSAPLSGHGGSSRWLSADWEYIQRIRPSRLPPLEVTPRVIVLDDSGQLKRFLARYLANGYLANATLLEAKSLADAGRIYRESPAQALVVNSESLGGKIDQVMLAAELPEDIPVFLCSLVSGQTEWQKQGVAEVLTKPIDRETLLAALDRLGTAVRTVLIVDDEPDILQLFGRILNSSPSGYRVLLARDGREALEVIEEQRPDVILLDLMMPNMNGFQFLETRLNTPRLRDIPIILISARDLSGQPVISSAVAVTKRTGLSIHEVLVVFEAISRLLSVDWPKGDPARPEVPAG